MNYNDFTFRAVVDWIEIAVKTDRATNFQALKRRIAVPFVTPVDLGAGGASTEFRFRVQDPTSARQVRDQLESLESRFPFAKRPSILELEVSVDAQQSHRDRQAHLKLLAHYASFTTNSNANKRFANVKGTVEGLPQFTSSLNRMLDCKSHYIGDSTDAVSQRLYLKETNNGAELPSDEHRARIEVTLRRDAVPLGLLGDIDKFKFERLTQYFRFRRPAEDLEPIPALFVQIPAARIGTRQKRGRTLYSPWTRADIELNEKIRNALRNLSRRWHGTRQFAPPLTVNARVQKFGASS
jgi:hypothetical protein